MSTFNSPKESDNLTSVIIGALIVDPKTETPIAVLKDETGERLLPIWMGTYEANAIALELEGMVPAFPMTHDLMVNLLKVSNLELKCVVITDLIDNTFHSKLVLNKNNYLGLSPAVEVFSRPSDAIALALRCKVPILVADKVFEKSAATAEAAEEASPAAEEPLAVDSAAPDIIEETKPEAAVAQSIPYVPAIQREVTYLDFEVEIGLSDNNQYPLSLLHSPAGEARETMVFHFNELELERHLQALQIALLRSSSSHRKILSTEDKVVQNFGKELFEMLIVGEIRNRYDISRQSALSQGKGLRIKLRFLTQFLAALPWEFMYDSRQADFICLSTQTPVVRYMELPQPYHPLIVRSPLKILGMIASPNDLPSINVERERLRIERALNDLQVKGVVQLTWVQGQTWRDLQKTLRNEDWHVFHFIGHGGFDLQNDEGIICLSDHSGAAHKLSATSLSRLLADNHTLRLVVLNSCDGARGGKIDIFSSTASILLRRGLSAVVAMQYEITDRAAIEFAQTFYESVADGLPVDASVTEARKSLSFVDINTFEWGTPVLYMRSPNGLLFNSHVNI